MVHGSSISCWFSNYYVDLKVTLLLKCYHLVKSAKSQKKQYKNCVHNNKNAKIMKKLLLMLLTVGVVFSASAQLPRGGKAPVRVIAPRVTVIGGYNPYIGGLGYGYGYRYGFNPYFGYNPFFGPRVYQAPRPTKLDLQIADIRNDFQDRIASVRQDKSLPRSERKAKVRELKHDRESAIINAKRNYYKTDYNS